MTTASPRPCRDLLVVLILVVLVPVRLDNIKTTPSGVLHGIKYKWVGGTYRFFVDELQEQGTLNVWRSSSKEPQYVSERKLEVTIRFA
jgi:hypothetical protein